MKPTNDLLTLAGLGVNLILDAEQKPTTDLIQIAGIIKMKSAHLTIKNASKKPLADLMQICSVCQGNITFEF
jgi:hypothetical protein